MKNTQYSKTSIYEHLPIMSNSLNWALCGPPERILLEMSLSIMSTSLFCKWAYFIGPLDNNNLYNMSNMCCIIGT
jgi:hypothetical protein